MTRVMAVVALVAAIGWVGMACAGEKTIATQKTKDVVVTLKSEAQEWKQGKNSFVIEFTSPTDKKPLDVGKVTLNTSMTMPGMAPMVAGATVTPDKTPGRHLGTIQFPDRGTRLVTVTWDGPAGQGSTKFAVPVR